MDCASKQLHVVHDVVELPGVPLRCPGTGHAAANTTTVPVQHDTDHRKEVPCCDWLGLLSFPSIEIRIIWQVAMLSYSDDTPASETSLP